MNIQNSKKYKRSNEIFAILGLTKKKLIDMAVSNDASMLRSLLLTQLYTRLVYEYKVEMYHEEAVAENFHDVIQQLNVISARNRACAFDEVYTIKRECECKFDSGSYTSESETDSSDESDDQSANENTYSGFSKYSDCGHVDPESEYSDVNILEAEDSDTSDEKITDVFTERKSTEIVKSQPRIIKLKVKNSSTIQISINQTVQINVKPQEPRGVLLQSYVNKSINDSDSEDGKDEAEYDSQSECNFYYHSILNKLFQKFSSEKSFSNVNVGRQKTPSHVFLVSYLRFPSVFQFFEPESITTTLDQFSGFPVGNTTEISEQEGWIEVRTKKNRRNSLK
ncbi:hypothetical protein A3Q56_06090 [Intoshia linei]|uniref:Uncharacterized protein n=1 Tax=Intoshia linei TaxID=1819745 RepID=A0A177AW42_9BILA|nr:hypothetical protein A3Q56_06090 [Intoshia linei]